MRAVHRLALVALGTLVLLLAVNPANGRALNTEALNRAAPNLVPTDPNVGASIDNSYIVVFDAATPSDTDVYRHFHALASAALASAAISSPNLPILPRDSDALLFADAFARHHVAQRKRVHLDSNTNNNDNIAVDNLNERDFQPNVSSPSRKAKSLGSLIVSVVDSVTSVFNTPADNVQPQQRPVHVAATTQDSANDEDMLLAVNTAALLSGFKVVHHYVLDGFSGYAADFPEDMVTTLEAEPLVGFIEPNRVVSMFASQKNAPSWGLGRVSSRKRAAPKNSAAKYEYPDSAGTDVDAYVIDTGIFIEHEDFEGRARLGKSFTKDGSITDDNGHGTHVAGTIGSKTFGVAKNVSLIAVKVLDGGGSGSTADVIAGIQYVAVNAPKSGRKSVANMSLGGGKSTAMDMAVKAAVEAGVTMVVAAGNSNGDACRLSPGSSPYALTVAASDITDKLAYFSEHGKCVDIIAPGVDITSTWNSGGINTISGTSMASPHVAGVVALALGEADFKTPEDVKKYLQTISSKDRITGRLFGTINDLVYNHVEDGDIPDDEPKEPKEPAGEDPSPPDENVCPFPQCLIDPACTDCDFGRGETTSPFDYPKDDSRFSSINILVDRVSGDVEISVLN